MGVPQYIEVNQFMQMLKRKDLVIVSRSELLADKDAELMRLRRDSLKKKSLTFKQVLDLKLLPIKSKQGLQNWINEGTILPGEVYETKKGIRMILTAALKRLGYIE